MAVDPSAFVTLAELDQFYPALAVSVPDDTIRECWLDLLKCEFNTDLWGCSLWRGHLYATVHALKCWIADSATATPGPTGQIASITQGPYSASFVVDAGGEGDGWWSKTNEGKAYLQLRDALGPVPIAMNMGGCGGAGRRRRRW